MLRPGSPDGRLSATGCIVVPLALFIALMLASAGVAIWPRMAAPGAAIICGGEVIYESYGASYRPGEYTVTRTLYCQTGDGKDARRDEITFQAAGISFLLYAIITFLLLQFVVRPLLRRRLGRTLDAARLRGLGGDASFSGLLGRVSRAVERDAAEEAARATRAEEAPGDVADRLARLRALRDQGLITAEDYDAKKAEILSRL
jgi:Short C-terminal domain